MNTPVSSKQSANNVFLSGRVVDSIRFGRSVLYDADQLDFVIESSLEDFKGKVHTQKILCRLLGPKAREIKQTLTPESLVMIHGRLKYNEQNNIGFVQTCDLEIA